MTIQNKPFLFSPKIVWVICQVLRFTLRNYPDYIKNLVTQLEVYSEIHYRYDK